MRVSPKTVAKVLREAEEGEDVDFKFKVMAKVSQIECLLDDLNKRLSVLEDRVRELEGRSEKLEPLFKEAFVREINEAFR